jgi:hypothetical protein
MVRSRRLPQTLLDAWLVLQKPLKPVAAYRLRLWKEHPPAYPAVAAQLAAYIEEILEDVRTKLRKGFVDSLSPFSTPTPDPAENYPRLLHKVTLQGYLGETLGVLAVEHWGAHGHSDWYVPALLFRLHEVEFQHLDSINQKLKSGVHHDPDDEKEKRPGRTGDDAIAFRVDKKNIITDVLTIEAKCLEAHKSATLKEAHRKVSEGLPIPTSVRELVNLLSDYETPAAERWQEAILSLWEQKHAAPKRFNGIAYACGNAPKYRAAWIGDTAPAIYKSHDGLEAMEFHLANVTSAVKAIYRT